MLTRYFHFPQFNGIVLGPLLISGMRSKSPSPGPLDPMQPSWAKMKGQIAWYVHFSFS
jgi:hypothetical protein